ncbi:MAG TPA: response regulator [Tepidisphaeraceae bacterium]|jgi:DNA-binding NtrC family response regulator
MNTQMNILYVDDHDDTCRAISRLLKLLGHEVTTANSVTTALAAANEKKFHLLISDIGLPDGDGHALLKEMLAVRPIHGIAVSGYGDSEEVEKSLNGGFAEHLVKPITVDQLQAAIERVKTKVSFGE